MAAGVQQHDVAAVQRVQKLRQFGKAHADGFGVVIRISADFDARAFQNAAVVVPRRVAHEGTRLRIPAFQKIRRQFQRARAAQRLHGDGAVLLQNGVFVAQQHAQCGGTEGGVAFHRQIGLRLNGLLHLGGAHGFGQRQAACIVKINADAQIDFVFARVVIEGFDQAQNRVARVGLEVLEHDGFPVGNKGGFGVQAALETCGRCVFKYR